MNKTFTFDDLIRYAYNETQLLESVQIRLAIENNEELSDQYSDLVNVLCELDNLSFTPSIVCVNNILEYSLNTAVSSEV